MSNWEQHKTMKELLKQHYINPESSWAKSFEEELRRNKFADRNLRSIQMRRGKIGITLHFQGKIEGKKLYSRFITK